jgi:hypothetical protein
MWIFDINATNIVALECKTTSTFWDPVHKVQNTIKITEEFAENSTAN